MIRLDSEEYRGIVAESVEPVVTAVPFDHPLGPVHLGHYRPGPRASCTATAGASRTPQIRRGMPTSGPARCLFWRTALSWMMWNFRVAGLLCGATVVGYSGHPLYPDADRLWALVESERVTYFGTSPGHLLASRKKRGCTRVPTMT